MKRTCLSIVMSTAFAFALCSACFGQTVVLRNAEKIKFPAWTDCNSPAHWHGNTMYLFNSAGHPERSNGPDQFHLGNTVKGVFDDVMHGGRWIECTWKNDDGVLYGWYHHEPGGMYPGNNLTAPKIGAVRSTDNGLNWKDLGIVLEARPDSFHPEAKNGYFTGGNGDFYAMLDKDKKHLYIFFSAYAGDITEQGVAIARMDWKDRDIPVGKVWKYFNGKWNEPGVGGRLTPIFQVKVNWVEENTDAFWGPSIHWNTYLKQYVILMNHAFGPNWKPEGVFITYNKNLANPKGWSEPYKIFNAGGMYCQMIGVDTKAKETDKLCGKQGRFYLAGNSNHEIIFLKEGEDPSVMPPVYVPENK